MKARYQDRYGSITVGLLALGLLATTEPLLAAERPDLPPIAITSVTIVDLLANRPGRTVVVANGRIDSIALDRDAVIPANAQRVDGRGRYLIPGLIDMHVHLFNLSSHRAPNDWTFALFVANGVTGVREMNANADALETVQQWRKEFAHGNLIGPRILAAGIAVQGESPQEAARDTDRAALAGADFIKVFSEVPAANWTVILDSARKHSLPVAGHVPAGVSVLAAANAGQSSDEHLMQLYEACSAAGEQHYLDSRRDLGSDELVARRDAQEGETLATFDRRQCDRIARALADTKQVQVPTLVLTYAELKRSAGPAPDTRLKYLRSDERARWERIAAAVTPDDLALMKQRWPVARQITAALHRARVTLLAGTDTLQPGVYPGFSLHEELALLVASGLTAREALRAATLAPAEFLGIDAESGSIAVGKRADLVLLDADPAKDIRNTQRINSVVLDGRLLRRDDLDRLLARAAHIAD